MKKCALLIAVLMMPFIGWAEEGRFQIVVDDPFDYLIDTKTGATWYSMTLNTDDRSLKTWEPISFTTISPAHIDPDGDLVNFDSARHLKLQNMMYEPKKKTAGN